MTNSEENTLRKENERLRAENKDLVELFNKLETFFYEVHLFSAKDHAVVKTNSCVDIDTKKTIADVCTDNYTYYLIELKIKGKLTQENVSAYMDQICGVDNVNFNWEYITDNQCIEDDFSTLIISHNYIALLIQ